MSRRSSGKALTPDPDLWEGMKAHGSAIADEVRWAKRTGRSANPKAKIISGLRWALNLGLDAYEEAHGEVERPTKQEVTLWATDRAGRLMSDTSDLRKRNRLYDFGFKIASDMRAAFSKGWSLGAGTTALMGPEANPHLIDPNVAVPERYKNVFTSFLEEIIRVELDEGGTVLLERRGLPGMKPIFVPVHFTEGADGALIQKQTDPEGKNALSNGAVMAIIKKGFFGFLRIGSGDRYVGPSASAFGMLAALYQEERKEIDAFRKTAEWRRRYEAMRMMGCNPDPTMSDRWHAEKRERLDRYVDLLKQKIKENRASTSAGDADENPLER